jgi:hypothetical protein
MVEVSGKILLLETYLIIIGFNIGASSEPAFDGSALANEEDVIIVTIKYELRYHPLHPDKNNSHY